MIFIKLILFKKYRLFVLFITFLLFFSSFIYAQNDTLVLKNEDRLIGEIKKMDRGVLHFKTKYSSGDLKLKWKQLESIKSSRKFLISLTNGKRLKIKGMYSEIKSDSIILKKDSTEIQANLSELVFIKPLKSSFMSKLDASVSVGYNYTKASNLSQLTLGASMGYSGDYFGAKATFSSVRSDQDDVEEIQRTYAELSLNYFLGWDYFLIYDAEFLSNSEQKLQLRVTNKLGIGKYLIHTNKMFLAAGGGIAWNNEQYSESTNDNPNSGEAFATVEANLFDFSDFSLLSAITAYPSLTEKGRLRADYKLDLKYDLPFDLFIKLGFNYNFDNQPVEGGAKDDFIIRTTLGWEL